MPTRAEIEARRGIVRDEQGRIIRSKEWIEQRIEMLKAKEADLQNRIKNIKAEIKQRKAELEEAE
jgi:chaperonin cofactor prefoldin